MVFNLDSVNSFIDANDGMVFDKLSNGEFDIINAVHVSKMSKSWWNKLSSIDKDFIDLIFGRKVVK
tara:strand:+ start:176 stop:373 length:198 start_codon:yes stop_codon:yes gene_type:complete